MTNKDLYRALSDVDTDMVLDAQPAPKRSRPVWARAVAIAACACLTVGVLATLPFISKWAAPDTPDVPGETVTPEQTEQQTEVPTAGQVIGDPIQGTVFLYVPSEEEKIDNTIPNNFSPSYLYGIGTKTENVSLTEYKNLKRSSPFTGETLVYQYTETTLKTTNKGEYGTHYCQFDRYFGDTETIAYLHGTEQVMFYSTDYNDDDSYPLMSENEVRALAEAFILTIITEEKFSDFTYIQTTTDPLGRYALLYRRYIDGYRTDETISIWVDRSGSISGYNGYNVGKYDNLVNLLNKDSIDHAYVKLKSKLESLNLKNLSCNEPKIIASSTGELFLQMAIFYDDPYDSRCGDTIVINIE